MISKRHPERCGRLKGGRIVTDRTAGRVSGVVRFRAAEALVLAFACFLAVSCAAKAGPFDGRPQERDQLARSVLSTLAIEAEETRYQGEWSGHAVFLVAVAEGISPPGQICLVAVPNENPARPLSACAEGGSAFSLASPQIGEIVFVPHYDQGSYLNYTQVSDFVIAIDRFD